MNVSKMVTYGFSLEEIEEEVKKCDVLCANCHRKEHYDPPAGVPQELLEQYE